MLARSTRVECHLSIRIASDEIKLTKFGKVSKSKSRKVSQNNNESALKIDDRLIIEIILIEQALSVLKLPILPPTFDSAYFYTIYNA